MPAVDSPGPPLSIRGTLSALRKPTGRDLLFSAKTALAASLCLFVAFSADLENPYWSALTVYVLVAQPQAGAFRTRAFFRIAGTCLGGAAAILLAALFAPDIGALLGAAIAAIVLLNYAKALDRTPANYTWFVMPLTIAAVDIAQVQAPESIFTVATTRMVEICLAVLAIGLIDSLIFPRAATPDFIRSMTDWCDRTAQSAAAVLLADAPETPEAHREQRQDLQRLAAFLGPLDAAGLQLPHDIVPTPPRGRDLRFLRLTITHLIACLVAADLWGEALRHRRAGADQLPAEVHIWMLERLPLTDPAILDHVARGEGLRDRLAAVAAGKMAPGGDDDIPRAAGLLRLSEFVGYWGQLERTLHAMVTGTGLPPALRERAIRARPLRSIDYVLGLLDAAPMALALGFLAALWFATNWTSAISAMLFAFISLGVVSGTSGALRSAEGIVLWIALACAVALVYQFAVLPRVTDFPVLIAVFTVGLVPLSLLMTMSPAGLLIIANGLALIGLQRTYAADFGATLESLLGAIAGCIIAVVALRLCQFDRARFTARRLARALRRDLLDTAAAGRFPQSDRLVSLGVDRIMLQGAAVAALPPDDPLRHEDLFGTLRVALDLLRLRAGQQTLPSSVRQPIAALCAAIATAYRGRVEPGLVLPSSLMEAAGNALLGQPPSAARTEALAALAGLRIALSVPAVFAGGSRGHIR